jgi:RHS repeat-associated protein
VTEIREDGANTRFNDYVYSADGTWTLRKGEGESNESRKQFVTNGRRTVRITVGDDTNGTASVVERTYQPFAWGEEIVEEVVDPDDGGAQLKTVTAYYENPDETGKFRQIKHRIEPDGSWVRYNYDDHRRVVSETRPWLDAPADPVTALDADSRVVQYSYAPVDPLDIANTLEGSTEQASGFGTPRVVAERVQGKLVSLSFASVRREGNGVVEIQERCPTPSSSFGDGSCLRTETSYYAEDVEAITSGKVRSVSYPDGRMDSYTYERGVWTGSAFTTGDGKAMRTTVTHGTVASPAGVPYKTRREVSVVDDLGHAVRDESYVYDGGYALVSWTASEYDAEGHLKRTTHSTGEEERATWGCCAEDTTTDSRGITTTYDRDKLERVRSATRAGVTTTFTYDGQGRQLTATRSGGGLSLTSSSQYDGAGRLKLSKDEAGLDTTYGYEAAGRITTVTRPGGFVEVTTRALDGQQRSVTGNAVVPQYIKYEVRGDGTRVSEAHAVSENSPVFERNFTDMLGRTVRVERPGFGGTVEVTVNTYNARGLLERTTTTGSAPMVYEYDALGNAVRSGLDVNENGTLDVASMDRISETDTRAVSVSGSYWQETTQRIYAEDNGGTPKVAGVTRSRLTGFSGGLVSDQVSIDLNGNETRSSVLINASNATETRVVDTPDSTINAVSVAAQGRLVSTTSTTGVTTTFGYDGLGRRNAVTDARTGTSITHYDSQGRVDYVEDAANTKTSFGYEGATGRKNRETNALGKHTYFAYDARGQLIRTWGDVPYPVQYVYDEYGRRTEMYTYREDAGWSSSTWPEGASGDVTKWHYEEATGLLQSKEDAAGEAVNYTYGLAGRLKTRTWARQKQGGGALWTKYDYDSKTGELVSVDYNDNTPDVTYTYDRLGRQKMVTDGTGSRTFAYDPATLQLQSETIDGITPAVLTRYYDPAGVKGRPVGLTLGSGYTVGWGYSAKGELQSVSWTANSASDVATYARVPASDLLAGYTTQSGFATTYAYEPKRDLKTQVQNKYGSTVVSQFDYAYDEIGRRTSVKNSGTAFAAAANTQWGYDDRNEVTGSNRYLGTNLTDTTRPVNAEQRAYGFDPIGNRSGATAAGVATSYTANNVNEYSAVGQSAPSYDDDGNLLNDGTKVLTYNAENQLKTVTVPGISVSTFDYDYLGRRVRKSVHFLSGGSSDYVATYVYSGWNKIQETKAIGSTTTIKNFVWGLDLSQSMEGAGGIGGLLAVVDGSGSASLFAYDGNGNVSELISSSTGSTAAHYEYSAFGETIVATGPLADSNNWRFSTKQIDSETGLYDYGLRPYSPELGRWVSRDPAQEDGGINLYGFIENDPVGRQDLLGLTQVGTILSAFMSYFDFGPTLWVMPEDDSYTKIVREWIAVREGMNALKADLAANVARWSTDHTTTSGWAPTIGIEVPGGRAAVFPDPRSVNKFIPGSRRIGTEPDQVEPEFKIWFFTGIQTDALHTGAIGSFNLYATVDRADSCGATLDVWMYNEMGKTSFGGFANHWFFRRRPMRSQFMWWHWKQEVAIRGTQVIELPANLGEYRTGTTE